MAQTVGDFLLKRLSQWGVKRIYGYPGDGINGIMGALGRNREMEFIQARHEELAAFMACAHAKFAGEIGVCLATSGPGAIHLLNGLYDARMDHQPVLAIVGQQKRSGLGGDYQQEVDLSAMLKDVAGAYVQTAIVPAQVRHITDSAVRITHLPTGLVVIQQDEKSQHKNKAKALKVLRSRLYEMERQARDNARAAQRKSQVGSGDRSERIRTYNFPQGRVTDHRINLTLYKIDKVMSGEALDEIIDAIHTEDQAARLATVEG